MSLAPVRDNVVSIHRRECACGCGKFTSGCKYVGVPGTREYNAHCNRAYRQRRASRDNHVINHYEAMLQSQNEMILQLREIVIELRARPTQAQSEAPTLRTVAPPKASTDDFELEIKAAVVDGKASVANFMRSLNGISTSYHEQAPVRIDVVESERTPGGVKKLAGGDVALSVPDFDDDSLANLID